jgi:hypothetical protein
LGVPDTVIVVEQHLEWMAHKQEDHTMPEGRQILMAMFQGGGNIPQLLPIVARLVARGHQV